MSQPVNGCMCEGCLFNTGLHAFLDDASKVALGSARLPNGKFLRYEPDNSDPNKPDIIGKVTAAYALWHNTDSAYERGKRWMLNRLATKLDSERQRLMSVTRPTTNWKSSPMCPWMYKSTWVNSGVTSNVGLPPKEEDNQDNQPKYTDATVVKLTELLLDAQRKGLFSRSMHDLATKLLKGLYDE